MLRNLLAVAFVVMLCTSALAVVVTPTLTFVPATSSVNKLNLTINASYSGINASDTESTTVQSGSTAALKLDYTFNPATRAVTSVNSIEFTGGHFTLANVSFDLVFAFIFHEYIDAAGVGGTFDTPTPPGSITGGSSATFPTEQHDVVLNQGTLTLSGVYVPSPPDPNPIDLSTNPIATTSTGTGTLTTTLASLVGGVATYNVEMLLPVNFNEPVNTGSTSLTATVAGTGTFKATGSFVVGNLAPVAYNDPAAGNESYYRGNEDTPITVNLAQGVLLNDVDSEALQAVQPSDPPHGSVTLNSNGSFTYTPDPNYNGSDTFTYKAYDGSLYSNLATVSVDVISVNDPPVAIDDSYTMTPDVLNTVLAAYGVRANDTDVETATSSLTVQKASDPSHGTLTLGAPGWFQYTPVTGFRGTDSFTYRAYDGAAYSNVATVELIVGSAQPIPGDANGDGQVNQTDATILAQHWGQSASGAAQGDFNGDGVANAADASIMAANWGYPSGEAGQSEVPEPGAVALLVGALGALGVARRRRAIG
jgi:VCBS repeat-containing protein